jgi:hypothetical protein
VGLDTQVKIIAIQNVLRVGYVSPGPNRPLGWLPVCSNHLHPHPTSTPHALNVSGHAHTRPPFAYHHAAPKSRVPKRLLLPRFRLANANGFLGNFRPLPPRRLAHAPIGFPQVVRFCGHAACSCSVTLFLCGAAPRAPKRTQCACCVLHCKQPTPTPVRAIHKSTCIHAHTGAVQRAMLLPNVNAALYCRCRQQHRHG